MKIVGFNYNKINIERISDSFKNLKVNTHLDIEDIKKLEVDFLHNDEEILGLKFKYLINYEPSIAKIEFEGNILITISPEKSKEILKGWKDKKILEEIKIPLFNTIMRKSSVKALQFQEEMNLPFHIPFPSIKKTDEETNSKPLNK